MHSVVGIFFISTSGEEGDFSDNDDGYPMFGLEVKSTLEKYLIIQ